MNMVVLICKWCGGDIEPLRDEPGEYNHVKDGYGPCWEYTAAAVNAEPISAFRRSGDSS